MAKEKKVKVGKRLRRSVRRRAGKSEVSKKDFHAILNKASQPVEPDKPET